jgi:hypothetical protein
MPLLFVLLFIEQSVSLEKEMINVASLMQLAWQNPICPCGMIEQSSHADNGLYTAKFRKKQ